MAALTPGRALPILLDKSIMRKHLGFITGTVGHFAFTKFLVNHEYPLDISRNVGVFEFVAAGADFQGRGIAHGLLKHLIESHDFESFVLEVAENNLPARALYERKLGFVEIKRIKAPLITGIGHLLYLKKEGKDILE